MKQTNIQISYDEEKLMAINLYINQKGSELNSELIICLDNLYKKYVPVNVRDFIDLKSDSTECVQSKKPINRIDKQSSGDIKSM